MAEDERTLRAKEDCLLGARFLWQELHDVWGHVSCRLPSGDGFALKMVRMSPDSDIDPDEVQVFDYDGKRLEGKTSTPMEITIHTEIFKMRPDVVSIIHAHPHMATALSTTGKNVFPITQQSSTFQDGFPLFRGNFIDGEVIANELAEQLGKREAILMKGHGIVTAGPSVPASFDTLMRVEQAATQITWASVLGTPAVLPQDMQDYRNSRNAAEAASGSREARGSALWNQLVWEWREKHAR
jgi:ribulose-5-phosphate 4-epimerase/fuculose-1-phosphate aldolase